MKIVVLFVVVNPARGCSLGHGMSHAFYSLRIPFASPILCSPTCAHLLMIRRADCDELKAIPLPLTGDLTVTLTEANAPCDNIGEGLLEDFVIEGGELTLTGLDVVT